MSDSSAEDRREGGDGPADSTRARAGEGGARAASSESGGEPVSVGIAVVQHQGKYLVGQRAASGPLAGYWEFPGGKCLPGERPAAAACRECLEETGLQVLPVDLLMHRQFSYPHGDVDLHFWLCRLAPRAVAAAQHQGFRWVTSQELAELRFPEANQPLIHVLAPGDRSG